MELHGFLQSPHLTSDSKLTSSKYSLSSSHVTQSSNRFPDSVTLSCSSRQTISEPVVFVNLCPQTSSQGECFVTRRLDTERSRKGSKASEDNGIIKAPVDI